MDVALVATNNIIFNLYNIMPVRATPISRANCYSTITNGHYLPINGPVNNCNNTLCFTYNHGYIYKPHSSYGSVGTTAASSLASRRRL